MNDLIETNIAFAVFCFIISAIILISVALSKHGKEKRSRLFVYIILVNKILLLTSIAWFLLNGNPNINTPIPIFIAECLKASCGPVMLILYSRLILVILKEKTTVSKHVIYATRIAIAVCIADIISIILDPLFFSYQLIGENNQLVRPELFFLSYIFTFVCMAINSGILFAKRKFLEKRELMSLIAYLLIPALGVIFHMAIEGTPINMVSITLAIVFYFAIIQNDLAKQTHELGREVVDSRISVMMSQIKPHFLYNALTAIVQLCDENPEQAKKAAMDFSAYLRSNMESLNRSSLISIEKEMDHVMHYLSLEKAIYGKALDVIYNIEACDFSIPPLTVQPIVENAVKHGIGKNEGGGIITVSIVETVNMYIITVTDNGAGYDTSTPLDKTKHVGIDNVRKRLELCGGTLEHISGPGEGTTATIRLPKL